MVQIAAGLVLARGAVEDAAHLLAAVEAVVARTHITPAAYEIADFAATQTAVQQQLDATSYAAAWTRGHALSLAQAITLALA